METIGIKELQVNPAKLTRALEAKQYTLIAKRGKPLGIAFAFNDMIISKGLQTALLIQSYKNSDLSLGQFSKALNISKRESMKLLSTMGVDIIDYNLKDDLKAIENFL